MNSSPSDLMSYYSLAKKHFKYKESIGDLFYGFKVQSMTGKAYDNVHEASI